MEHHEHFGAKFVVIEAKSSACAARTEFVSTPVQARDKALNLPLTIPAKTGPRRRTPAAATRLPSAEELSGAVVVFGAATDPLLPFDENFDLTVSMLKMLAQSDIKELYLQTRSPIIVILLPLLQSFGNKLTVIFGIETTDDQFAREYTPDLPLASERIKAANVLSKFGIRVIVQTTQLPALPYPSQLLKKSVQELDRVAAAVRVVPFAHLFEPVHRSLTANFASTKELLTELQRICPEKIILSAEPAKQEAA